MEMKKGIEEDEGEEDLLSYVHSIGIKFLSRNVFSCSHTKYWILKSRKLKNLRRKTD